jgi:hypothetical protein
VLEPGRGRPTDGAGKTGDQRDAGDRSARTPAIEAGQRGEGGVVETHPDAETKNRPGNDQRAETARAAQQDEAGADDQVRGREDRAAAMAVDQPTDPRPDHRREQQCPGEDRKKGARWEPEGGGDRRPEDRRQVIGRGPGDRLRGADGGDDAELLRSHARLLGRAPLPAPFRARHDPAMASPIIADL